MRVLLIYHFFHPDTVISARLFSDLAQAFVRAGHEVTVYTGNRLIRAAEKLQASEDWDGVRIRRFSRPDFSQGNNFGRLFNSFFLQLKWIFAFFRERKRYDCVIVGTDPQFSYLMFPFFRFANKKLRLIHWTFDLYPEALLIDSSLWMRIGGTLMKPFAQLAYRHVDDMVDIGSGMRELLLRYHHKARCVTLTPWALAEPAEIPHPDSAIRKDLFGNAKIGILYSGTVGYAHDLRPFFNLARECRKQKLDVAFCFAGYGNQYQAQTAEITAEDSNIRLAGFTTEEELEKRLAAADIHMISLHRKWGGIVVPSKFFGSLAIGRPVLFSGPENCGIFHWCGEYHLGSVLNENTVNWLRELLNSPEKLSVMEENAYYCYQRHFSKENMIKGWLNLLER